MKASYSAFLCFICCSAAALADELRIDKSGAFEYRLPEGWKVFPNTTTPHDRLLLPGEDGLNRNLTINNQGGTSDFPALKAKYERDLAAGLKDFKLVASEIVQLKNVGKAIRIVHTNTHPGIPVRQINYIIELRDRRYFIACALPEADGDKFDAAVAAFVDTLRSNIADVDRGLGELVLSDALPEGFSARVQEIKAGPPGPGNPGTVRRAIVMSQAKAAARQIAGAIIQLEDRELPTDQHKIAALKGYIGGSNQPWIDRGYQISKQDSPDFDSVDTSKRTTARFTLQREAQKLEMQHLVFLTGPSIHVAVFADNDEDFQTLSKWADSIRPKK